MKKRKKRSVSLPHHVDKWLGKKSKKIEMSISGVIAHYLMKSMESEVKLDEK